MRKIGENIRPLGVMFQMVRQLNIPLDDKVFKKIKKARELSSATSWASWLLELIEMSRRENELN